MPLIKGWAGKGRKYCARILSANKHAGRMTAVLTVRENGAKLQILFILRGVAGVTKENSEFETYPSGHFYLMQENGWISEVGQEGHRLVAVAANATVIPLPPNSTAVCQSLDVGVVGPLKATLRHSAKCTGGSAKEKRLRLFSLLLLHGMPFHIAQ
ncbi:Hypothetical protein PHPALM_6623 [Phytophthora palmivora]|uniref:Uncharacterized protein n=1 Tax=Phytophthora palmivora TaxID=4796 RepID=A0A2P4YEE2_9STRA|nr:Hypothetical protein PHPALM_6623 [Phytophthora palmivora]